MLAQPERAPLVIEEATPEDGRHIWELVGHVGTLERNTAYAYVLLATYFRKTVLVARCGGKPVGAVVGFIVPDRPNTVFVWQIGVLPEMRGRGVGLRLLRSLVERLVDRDLQYVEATVTPDNIASASLFRKLAESYAAEFRVLSGFDVDLFPGGGHEPERLVRIGPLFSTQTQHIQLS